MKNILCYGDSNTWGHNPDGDDPRNKRFTREQRWPCLLQKNLGDEYYIVEEALCGRTTVFDDPTVPGRRGVDFFHTCIQSHQPLDLILIMLGVNDVKAIFNVPVLEIANGMAALVKIAQNPFSTDRRVPPEILIVSPIWVGDQIQSSWLWEMFDLDSLAKSKKLADAYRLVAEEYGCHFFDAATVAKPSSSDSIHMDLAGCKSLADALTGEIHKILD